MRKIISLVLALLTLFSAAVSVSAYNYSLSQNFVNDETFSMGDCNDDGEVNAIDALILKMMITGSEEAVSRAIAVDFIADGVYNGKDAYCLKLCLADIKKPESFENGKQTYKFTIGGNDISEYALLLNEGITDENNSFLAALHFQKYVKKIMEVDLPVYYGEAPTDKVIYLNEIDIKSERGRELGIEGYKYEVKDGALTIEGTYRGTMYAVYEILEDYLGIRFFSDYETFVFKQRASDIAEGTVEEYVPPIVFRHACQSYSNGSGPLWHYFANKLNGKQLYAYDHKRYGTLSGPLYSNAHSFYEYWKMATGTEPENAAELTEQEVIEARFASGTAPDPYNWQPCATSNDHYNKLFAGMLLCNKMSMYWGNELHYDEEINVFSFSILDNQHYCNCRNCTKISKVEGYSGLYLQLYNRAVVDIQEYYPGLRLYGIVYAKDFPKTIKPHDKLVILYCGTGCNNHMIGREDCYEKGGQLNNMNNNGDVKALEFWGNICKETGAELWFWVYPVTYHYYLVGCPNIPNLYYDTKYLVDKCNVNGIYYEGGGRDYNFENLKAYVSVRLFWDPSMTYEEFVDIMKEYLYMYYGEGYEDIYKYIEMQTEAGDQSGTCFINNYDRPGDMYSYAYLAENYGEMRALLESALDKAERDEQIERIEKLLVCCDFMGLSSVHTDWYANGNNVEAYKERYDWMYNKMKALDMIVFSSDLYNIPDTLDYEINPMIQFYVEGSRRPAVYP